MEKVRLHLRISDANVDEHHADFTAGDFVFEVDDSIQDSLYTAFSLIMHQYNRAWGKKVKKYNLFGRIVCFDPSRMIYYSEDEPKQWITVECFRHINQGNTISDLGTPLEENINET